MIGAIRLAEIIHVFLKANPVADDPDQFSRYEIITILTRHDHYWAALAARTY